MHYREIAQVLRDRIYSGVLPSGRLPTERELSLEFAVTRVTIRRALRVLEDERLIRRIQGSGTYVNPVSSRRIPLMIDYTGSMKTHAPNLVRRVLSLARGTCDESVAALLKIKTGVPVLHFQRVDCSGSIPIATDEGFLPLAFGEKVTRELLADIAFLEEWSEISGFRITWCNQNIEAVAAAEECGRRLQLSPGSPVLKSTEIYYADRDTPAGLFISHYHPTHIAIHSRYDWPSSRAPEPSGLARPVPHPALAETAEGE